MKANLILVNLINQQIKKRQINLKGEDIIENVLEKELLLSNLQMSYYSERDSHIGNKIKVILGLSNQATNKELDDATGINTFD